MKTLKLFENCLLGDMTRAHNNIQINWYHSTKHLCSEAAAADTALKNSHCMVLSQIPHKIQISKIYNECIIY